MKVGAYSTLIVAVILGVVLTTSLMVPVIANVDAGQTEEKLVPTDVTNGELFDSRHNAPVGMWNMEYVDGAVYQSVEINYNKIYVDVDSWRMDTFWLEGTITDAGDEYECHLISWGGTGYRVMDVPFGIFKDEAEEFGISDKGNCMATVCMYISENYMGNQLIADVTIGNSGNFEDRPTVSLTIIPKGVVAYDGKPDITSNGYDTDQAMLKSGLTTNATTDAYYISGIATNGERVVDKVTHNNTLVGYLNNDETQPVFKFNANNGIDLFAPIDNTFLGVETVEYTDYYNVKDVIIYEKQQVPVDSPIKWVLAIIPVMVLVGIVVYIINTQIVQKRD